MGCANVYCGDGPTCGDGWIRATYTLWMPSSRTTAAARLLARPILQEYDASTVDVLAMNPSEFGNLANRTTLWKSQEPVGGKRTLAQWISLSGRYEVRNHKMENPA